MVYEPRGTEMHCAGGATLAEVVLSSTPRFGENNLVMLISMWRRVVA